MPVSTVASPQDGTPLHTTVTGQGPALLLCDGIFCDGHIWRAVLPAWTARYTVIRWHYPGHGRSGIPVRPTDLSPSRLARDARAVLDHWNVRTAVLIGHSFGVRVALETARHFPDETAGLVLLCGAADRLLDHLAGRPAVGMAVGLAAASWFVPRAVQRLWQRLPEKAVFDWAPRTGLFNAQLLDAEFLRPYLDGLKRTDLPTALTMLVEAERVALHPHLHQLPMPCLVMAGQKDKFIPFSASKELARNLPHCQFIPSVDGTHALPLEQPELVVVAVEHFLHSIQIRDRHGRQ